MLVACRLAGLSALEGHYADDNAQAQSGVEKPEVAKAAERVEIRCARRGDQCGADERQSRALAGLPSA
jgi:hypothetical protein